MLILDMRLLVMLAISLLITMALPVFATWEEVPGKGTQVDFGGIFNKDATAFDGTAIHAEKNFWVGINGSQVRAEGEIVSDDLSARVQGGFEMLGVSLQGFVEQSRDIKSVSTIASGAYLRKVVEADSLDLIFGFGSLVEREEIRDDLGLDETSPEVLPYWLAIIGAEYDFASNIGLYSKIVGQPEISLSAFAGEFLVGVDIAIDDSLTLKIQSVSDVSIKESDGFCIDDTRNSVLLSYKR